MKQVLFMLMLALSQMTVAGQTLATNYKEVNHGNPISPCVFCADPTALVYKGRLYLYGTNDHQQYIANGKTGSNGYGNIKSLVVFSTEDMVNWTFHGTIDVSKVCTWAGQSWAPSAVWRTATNGEDEFFMYFANGGGSVGVMKANSPLGPWSSPLSSAMIKHGTPGVDPCNWVFDPGAVIDENGTGWIAFGGGDPLSSGTKLMPGNSRIAKLKPSMTAIDGSAVNLPAPYLFEASELNIMDGRFVYTYNTSWSDRNDWNKYDKRGSQPSPSSCSMCYMVTDTPLDPDSWEYRGEYVPNEGSFGALGADWGNNHTHLQKFQGNYYLFYHGNVLEKTMKSNGAMNSEASGYRSLCVNKLTVDESTQTLNKVNMTKTGPASIKNLNPYELQQAETMATCGGISYEDFTNISKLTSISSLGNDASRNMLVKMAEGAWTVVKKVDFGEEGATSFTIRARGTGTLEVRLEGKKTAAAATVEFSSTSFEEHTIEVDPEKFKGVKTNLYFVCTASQGVRFDTWQFGNATTGVEALESDTNSKPVSRQTFDLSGRRISPNSHHGQFVIEQTTDERGIKHSRIVYK